MNRDRDIFGKALFDYHFHGVDSDVLVHNNYGAPEKYLLTSYFKDPGDFSELEFFGMQQCSGYVLDIGSGTGSQSLYLNSMGLHVDSIENSHHCIEIMRDRGVQTPIHQDIFRYGGKKYDTLFLMMNGIGIAGNLGRLPALLIKFSELLKPGGQVLFDSCDITYLYHDIPIPLDRYFGEVKFQFECNGQLGDLFDWLYLDPDKLKYIARKYGWYVQVIYENEADSYLARLVRK